MAAHHCLVRIGLAAVLSIGAKDYDTIKVRRANNPIYRLCVGWLASDRDSREFPGPAAAQKRTTSK
jgi:hypothetical protein